MFSVKYKFPAWKDEEIKTVHFDGANISVAEMRNAVANQTQCDPLDLIFKDHATNDQFPDEGTIPRNSYVIAYRILSKRTALGAPARAPRRHTPNVPPPENYVCDRCRGTGHYKANCPTLDNPAYDAGFATPAGIPSSMTISASLESGTIRLPNGTIASLKTDHEALDAVAAQRRQKEESYASIPEHMRCTISRDLLRDPHTVPCCKSNFCAKCILPDSLHDAIQCPNCSKTVTGDKITANLTLAQEIELWRKETNFVDLAPLTSSTASIIPIITPTSQTTTKVERRKPPPRRGAATAAPATSSTSTEPSTLSTTSSPPSNGNHGPPSKIESQENAVSISTPTQNEDLRSQPTVSVSSATPASSVAASSQNHAQSRLDKIKMARNSGNNSTPTDQTTADTRSSSSSIPEKSTDVRSLSPKSRLKQIAALREAKRGNSQSTPSSAAATSDEQLNDPHIEKSMNKESRAGDGRRSSPNGRRDHETRNRGYSRDDKYDRATSSGTNGDTRRFDDDRVYERETSSDRQKDSHSRSTDYQGRGRDDYEKDSDRLRGSSRRDDEYEDRGADARPSSHHRGRGESKASRGSSSDYDHKSRDNRDSRDSRDDRREKSDRYLDSRRYDDDRYSSSDRRDNRRDYKDDRGRDDSRQSRDKRRRDDSSPRRRDDDYDYSRHGPSKSRKESEYSSVHDRR